MEEDRGDIGDRNGHGDPTQPDQNDVGCPVDTVPWKGADSVLPANGQAEMEVVVTGRINRVQGLPCTAVEKLQAGWVVKTGRPHREGRRPYEEIDDVPHASAQK